MALSRKLNRCHVGDCAHVQLGDWSHHACSPVGLSVLICKIGGAERPVTERAWEVGAGLHACSTAKEVETQEMRVRSLGLGRSLGGGHGNPLQCSSCPESPMDRGVWQAIVYGVAESDMTEVTGRIKDLTQEQLDGRDAKDRVWGKELGFPCPLRGYHCPQSSTAYQPGSSLNPILLGCYEAFIT